MADDKSEEKAYCCGIKTVNGAIGLVKAIPSIILTLWLLLSPIVTIIAPIVHYLGLLAMDKDNPLLGAIAILVIGGDVLFALIVGSEIKRTYDKDSKRWYCRIITWIIVSIGRLSLTLKRCV